MAVKNNAWWAKGQPFAEPEFAPPSRRSFLQALVPRTTQGAADIVYHNPFWPTSEWGRGEVQSLTPEAGIVHVTSPAHPFAGAESEQWIEMDLANAAHQTSLAWHGVTSISTTNGPPDQTKRWGYRAGFLFRHGKTAGTYDALPTADALIYIRTEAASGPGTTIFRLYYTTTGTLKLTAQNTGGSELTVGQSSVLFTLTNYGVELWAVYNDSAGNLLGTRNWQLRLLSNFVSGSPPAMTTEFNTNYPLFGGVRMASGANVVLGEDVSRGSNCRVYLGNVFGGWDNADNPYGMLRGDRLDPTSLSLGANMSQWTTPAAANVDESGTAVPDDVVTQDTVAFGTAASPKTQLYQLAAPGYVTAADAVVGAVLNVRHVNPLQSKGFTATSTPMFGDGTNLVSGAGNTSGSANFVTFSGSLVDKPSGTPGGGIGYADLGPLEAGIRAATDGGTITFQVSTITVTVVYQKAGETTGPLNPRPLDVVTLRRQAPILEPDFAPRLAPPVVTLLTQPAVVVTAMAVTLWHRDTVRVEPEVVPGVQSDRMTTLVPDRPTATYLWHQQAVRAEPEQIPAVQVNQVVVLRPERAATVYLWHVQAVQVEPEAVPRVQVNVTVTLLADRPASVYLWHRQTPQVEQEQAARLAPPYAGLLAAGVAAMPVYLWRQNQQWRQEQPVEAPQRGGAYGTLPRRARATVFGQPVIRGPLR